MTADDQLTQLAMGKSGWRDDNMELELSNGHIATRADWLQRRTELINEPDDADAPEWAEWKAQKASGWWMYCESEPALADGQWIVYGLHEDRNVGKLPAGHDWRDTLKRVEHKTKPAKMRAMTLCPQTLQEVEAWVASDPHVAAQELMALRRHVKDLTGADIKGGMAD